MFGWTPDQVLAMRARQFFLVLSQARIQKDREKISEFYEHCWIASISLGDAKWFEEIKSMYQDKFKSLLMEETLPVVTEKSAEVQAASRAIQSESTDARYALMGVFGRARH